MLYNGAIGFLGALVDIPVLLSLLVGVIVLLRWAVTAIGLQKPHKT